MSAADVLSIVQDSTTVITEALQQVARFVEHGAAEEEDDDVLTKAAACYMVFSDLKPPQEWPLAPELWEPTTRRADLIKALALYLLWIAKIDRKAGW